MPKFFLHIRRGDELIEDVDGEELPDLDSARSEAIASAREILSERIKSSATADGDQVEVCDESGKVLATVPFLSLLKPSNEPVPNAPEKTVADCRCNAAKCRKRAEEVMDTESKAHWQEIAADWEYLATAKESSQRKANDHHH